MVVLDTTSPSTPNFRATAATSALSASARSGATFTRSGGGPAHSRRGIIWLAALPPAPAYFQMLWNNVWHHRMT